MSLSSSMNSALSGLTAARTAALTVSDNIANALTPGYSAKSLDLLANRDQLPGVRVAGVTRHSDPIVTAARREAQAQNAENATALSFFENLARDMGEPTQADSLSAQVSDLEASLVEAASRPQSQARLDRVAYRFQSVAQKLNQISDGIQSERQRADAQISQQVGRLNQLLNNVADLNVRIASERPKSAQTASLTDQRDLLIDEINEQIPVRTLSRGRGQIALVTDGGAILLDGRPARIGFDPTPTIAPHITVESGSLSGLTLNDRSVSLSENANAIGGGALAAQFHVRDVASVDAQSDLDTLAEDLLLRFQDPGLDPTRATGQPAILTDQGAVYQGAVYQVANRTGLAGRIALNQALSPNNAGETWRLRSGLGAADPGQPGDAALLNRLSAALTSSSSLMGSGQASHVGSAPDHIAQSLSALETRRSEAERALSFSSGLLEGAREAELGLGVDTDEQLQTLLLIEQNYAANAQVLRTVDDLMNRLLEI